MRHALSTGFPTATDLADWMVRELNLPFREAHHATGMIVAMAESRGCRLDELNLDELKSVLPAITEDVLPILHVDHSVNSRTSEGGTAPGEVLKAIRAFRKEVEF